jgi:hypothetical protein
MSPARLSLAGSRWRVLGMGRSPSVDAAGSPHCEPTGAGRVHAPRLPRPTSPRCLFAMRTSRPTSPAPFVPASPSDNWESPKEAAARQWSSPTRGCRAAWRGRDDRHELGVEPNQPRLTIPAAHHRPAGLRSATGRPDLGRPAGHLPDAARPLARSCRPPAGRRSGYALEVGKLSEIPYKGVSRAS